MKCKQCCLPVSGKSQYCSESCKTVYNRNKRAGTSGPEQVAGTVPASLDEYADSHGRKYAHRAHPDELNWGPWMNSEQLEQARLRANRVSIPGDWDYVGVAV